MITRRLAVHFILLSCLVSSIAYADTEYIQELSGSLCGGRLKASPSAIASVDDGRKVYVTDSAANRIMVIAAASNKLESRITTPGPTDEISVSPDSHTAYVLTNGPAGTGDKPAILSIDTRSDKIVSTLRLRSGHVNGLWVSKDGSEVYVSTGSSRDISVLSVNGKGRSGVRTLHTQALGRTTRDLAFVGRNIYYLYSDHLYVAPTKGNDRETALSLGGIEQRSISVSPDGSMLALTAYPLSNSGSNNVTFINTADRSQVGSVLIEGKPVSSVFAEDGTSLYVYVENASYTQTFATTLFVIDMKSKKVVTTIPMKGRLGPAVMSPDNKRMYAITGRFIPDAKRVLAMDTITVLNTETNAIVGEIKIPIPDTTERGKCG